MDEIDKNILTILQKNDKEPYYKIGKQLNSGASTIHFRVKKMVEQKIIKQFSAIVCPEKAGYKTTAWLGLSVDPQKLHVVAKQLTAFKETQTVATATGDHDIIVQLIAKNEKDLWRFINQHIKTMDGIEKNFDVSTFLDVYKQTPYVPMDDG